ncbi:DsbC family protein [Thermodesulfobacterium hydrogeniphilum]|uniref:DsbC family protein n=1 Tax=Thermodesulfobacterium hydrogeniphilum TaxID=161156 RepID=UPI00056FF469|nr:DsbC family protein [Thermodesulfobacterium hydrogeniphilum]
MKNFKGYLFIFIGLFIILFTLMSCKNGSTSSGNCPSVKTFQKNLDTLLPGIKIEKIEKSPIHGLCEVIVKLSEVKKGLIYTDSKGKYIITGNIIDIKNKKNLTRNKLEEINKRIANHEVLSKLDSLVDMVYGNSPNVVYLITDPLCPFCYKAEKIVDQLVKEGKLKVKVILIPLEKLHPGSTKVCVSLICDKKGYSDLLAKYESSNQCNVGKEKVNKNFNYILKDLKIYAVPTFVFPDGEIKSGVLSPKYILNKFNKKENKKLSQK